MQTSVPVKSDKSREVRLGLVMYGGVSLAIYINGVTHELFRTVRGRGVYRLIKQMTDSDVVVDVLSGSSAGGINGIFLGYALCNEVEFSRSADLWRKHGDIDRLLRDTDAPLDEYRSLLNSEGYYHPQLENAFAEMAKDGDITPAVKATEDNSPVKELDLLITGTDFNGRIYGTVDDHGSVIQVKEHRTLFWLKHRQGRKHPFHQTDPKADAPAQGYASGNFATHEALATLARITSCFPAAFSPVTVPAQATGAAGRLRRWAALKDDEERVFIDGGVLDNKPFMSTLDAIYHRTAERPVARHLLYVEPDPEQFGDRPTKVEPPNIIRTAIDSLTRLPGYESIADDLRSLSAHNDRINRLNCVARLDAKAAKESGHSGGDDTIYQQARLAGLTDSVFAALFEVELGALPQAGEARAHLATLRRWFDVNVIEQPTVGNDLLDRFDIQRPMRRLFHLTYTCEAQLGEHPALLRTINNQIQTLEIVRGAMEAAVSRVATKDRAPEEIWADVATAVQRVLSAPPPADYQRRDPTVVLLDDSARQILKTTLDDIVAGKAQPAGGTSLLQAAKNFETALLDKVAEPGGEELRAAYDGFVSRDKALYPLEVVSGIREKDVIHTVRVSPIDARVGLSDRLLKEKVTGVNLGHFGAFFKRSWRSNDILWGRLDAACELVDTLLDGRRLFTLLLAQKLPVAADLALADRLPYLAPTKRALLAQRWTSMTDEATIARELPGIKTLLIEAAQNEILADALPGVIEDAANEQLAWNVYRGRSASLSIDAGTMEIRMGSDFIDPAVIAFSAGELARKAIDDIVKGNGADELARVFKDRYRVGQETLDDIPRVVVLDILARALLVLRNCLLLVVGPRAHDIRDSLVFKATLDWPLRTLAALAGGLRRAPGSAGAFIIGAVLYTGISVLVAAKTLPQYQYVRDVPTWGAVLFGGLPVLLLLVAGSMANHRSDDSRKAWLLRGSWQVVKVATTTAVVAVLAALWFIPSNDLCLKLFQHLSLASTCDNHWVTRAMTAGKFLLLVGTLFTAAFGRVVACLRRLLAWRKKSHQPRSFMATPSRADQRIDQ